MQARELRRRFLGFFAEHGHRIVPSSSLVPHDPTLLFTAAGMVQFKDIFWGRVKPEFSRAASCQKCFRTTDIENVGRTAYHQTFFEMLGNFSFGDYFKEEAIGLAWSFVTEELGIAAERLWASVYEEDEEAYAIWRDVVGLPPERIVRLGKEHNWWGPVGDSGPCGPDSELHYDTGEENACGPDCTGLACDCDRFAEFWNLVFMQYEAKKGGGLVPLAKKNIDTGMGLERAAAILQGVKTNFDIDLFRPIVEAIEAKVKGGISAERLPYRNTIADHVRGVVFLLADGVMPGNERQGYVLRRILRRAIRAGENLELPPGSLAGFVDPVIESLGEVYPEIVPIRSLAERLVFREEETFRRTLRSGEERLERLIDRLKKAGESVLPGELAFELTDTYGFPLELTEEIAAEEGIAVDLDGFERALAEQRKRSKEPSVRIEASASLKVQPTVVHRWHREPTEFVGYKDLEAEAEIVGIEEEEKKLLQIAFSKTPFYALGGGQIGDTGTVENLSRPGKGIVRDTRKADGGATLHYVKVDEGRFEVGDTCRLSVDVSRRRRIERNHTATHLIHAALRTVLGPHATQAGSEVTDRELRFDFSHFMRLTEEELHLVEDKANEAVLADHPVMTSILPLEEAKKSGAIGLFEEEYRTRDRVRVVSVGDVSKELCGGTHVRRSGEIGLIKIVSEEGIASGVRRIRAITGDSVIARIREEEDLLFRVKEELGDDPVAGARRLKEELRELRSRLDAIETERAISLAEDILASSESVGQVRLIGGRVDRMEVERLKMIADRLEERGRPAVVILVGDASGRGIAICKVSKEIGGVDAGDLVRRMAKTLGGGGGGGSLFAQGGGPGVDRLDEALAAGLSAARKGIAI